MLVTSLGSRVKHESSSSDEERTAARPSSTGHLPLLSSIGYKKTLRLTSEQLVSVWPFASLPVGTGQGLAPGPGACDVWVSLC